jgi:hypothetical protein
VVARVHARSPDLQQEDTCPKRKEAVAKLRALGDTRAVEALQQAIDRRALSNPKFQINKCLADDARAAIGAIRGLKKPQ